MLRCITQLSSHGSPMIFCGGQDGVQCTISILPPAVGHPLTQRHTMCQVQAENTPLKCRNGVDLYGIRV